MKKLLTTILLALTLTSAFGQLNDRVGRTPAITNDWREGIINITEFNAGLGLGIITVPYSRNYFGITNVTGYQFSRNAKAGVGIGFQVHNGGTLIPLYVDGRFSANSQEVVPFLALAGGLAISPDNMNTQTRVFINPSVGVRYVNVPKVVFTFSVGLMTQAGGGESRSSFICFKLGTEFKKLR